MNKKLVALFSLLIILTFIGYIVYDTARTNSRSEKADKSAVTPVYPENWILSKTFSQSDGTLTSVALSDNGKVYLGGESFVACYGKDMAKEWTSKMNEKITALAVCGDSVYASSARNIYLVSTSGKQTGEWGPYEANSIITSLSANKDYVAAADAGAKVIFILKKDGEVAGMIGQGERKFIIPSSFFDVALCNDNTLFAANTGNHRIEKWTTGGEFISQFGKAGDAPDEFTACCNPSHFAVIPQGFVTAEKGLNRIKILDNKGNFVEFVSSKNNFVRPVPLDVASTDGKTIYAANPADSKLYVFTRK